MDPLEENVIRQLIAKYTSCPTKHALNKQSYASPAHMKTGRLMDVEDLPMSCSNSKEERPTSIDQDTTAWDDSAKNLIFDLTCVDDSMKYEAIILLYEFGYKLPTTTARGMVNKNGLPGTVSVECMPVDERSTEFTITVRQFGMLVDTLVIPHSILITTITDWYLDNNTLIVCHDSLIPVYRRTVEMMSDSTWSIQCNITDFVVALDSDVKCRYYMNVYGYPRSTESRAVGTGQMKFIQKTGNSSYNDKANFYNRCIRGSRHSSGKCYDCHMLYTVISSIDASYKSNQTAAQSVTFSSIFLKSIKEGMAF